MAEPIPVTLTPAAPVISPTPQPAPVESTFAERVAATGSAPASEDAQSAGVRLAHLDRRNGAVGRAQAAGGSDAIARMDRERDRPLVS